MEELLGTPPANQDQHRTGADGSDMGLALTDLQGLARRRLMGKREVIQEDLEASISAHGHRYTREVLEGLDEKIWSSDLDLRVKEHVEHSNLDPWGLPLPAEVRE